MFAIASVMGLVFGGLRVADAISTSNSYGRTAQLAELGVQSTALAQDLENERDLTAAVAAYTDLQGRATGNTAGIKADLKAANAVMVQAQARTNAEVKVITPLAEAIGSGFTSSVQGKAAGVLSLIEGLPGTRSSAVGAGVAPDAVINSYTSAIGNLFLMDDVITSGSGDAALSDSVRALGGISRAKDDASQQRAILNSALIEATVPDEPGGLNNLGTPPKGGGDSQALTDAGGLSALTTANGQQETDLSTFSNAATQPQQDAFLTTVGGAANDAQLIEGFVPLAGGDPRSTFMQAGGAGSLGIAKEDKVVTTAYQDMTSLIDQFRTVEQQVMTSIVDGSQSAKNSAFDSALITVAITVAAILIVLLLTYLVGRTLVNPLRRLRADALEIASVRLPARVAAAAAATEAPEGPVIVEPVGVQSTDEIGEVARAFDQVHSEAVRLAGNEASLRGSLNAMFISLSRRSVPLIDRLARMIDGMEQSEDDPDQLANLFSMDHLVTRMRRNSENLLVLAGEEPVRKWSEPVPLADVARAAAAEIEQYNRVSLTVQAGVMVSGQAAADVVHLLAELIENATLFSPQNTQVRVSVMELASGGVLVEIRDDGVGISPTRLADMNWRLDHPPGLDVSVSRHMGLYAVAHLAARHGIRIRLRPGAPQGLSALVWLPNTLARQEHGPAVGGSRPVGGSTSPGLPTGSRPVPTAASVPAAPVRPGLASGRHRNGLADEGGDYNGQGGLPGRELPGRGEAPGRGDYSGRRDLPRRPSQPAGAGRGGQAGRPATAWFAPKRPSNGAAPSQEDVAANWQPFAGSPGAHGGWGANGSWPSGPGSDYTGLNGGSGAGAAEPSERTSAGLPRRTPQTNAHPGLSTPDFEAPAASGPAPVLGAPADGQGSGYQESYQQPAQRETRRQEAPRGDQLPTRRRSPDAVRSRLTGFQLGTRDAVQPGPDPRVAPNAGEENHR